MKNFKFNEGIRNIAIIAHVDHGKTTLVDAMFRQSGMFREEQEVDERLMDSMDLERERGITISAKNCSVKWKGIKINIIDTPGHADFGGEVERALSMADGALLLVDAAEGPLPQTRFVLSKTLEAGLRVITVINKIDRKDIRPDEVLDEIYDLFIDLNATEEQLDFSCIYAVGRDGVAKKDIDDTASDLRVLFDTIIEEIPPPAYDPDQPFQMLVADLSYSSYLGRLAVGRVFNGSAKANDRLACICEHGEPAPLKISSLQICEGIGFQPANSVEPGDIAMLSGIEEVHIGDTICTAENPSPLHRIAVDEPTVSMRFGINTSPFSGMEGKLVQSNKIRERLSLETLRNVGIKVEENQDRESFLVKGRGEFQLAILIETMRREGFELSLGRPEVILKLENNKKLEPVEHLFVDCEETYLGVVTEKISIRKGRMSNLINHGTGRVRIEFDVPTRALIGYRDEFLSDTRGNGIMNSYFKSYEDYRGDFPSRHSGSICADRQGKATPYALFNLEPRGQLFVKPDALVYEGMIVGVHNREGDINVNICKEKKLSNMRAAGKDQAVVLAPGIPMTLEKAITFIREDEMVEVTPKSIRLRKTELSAQKRSLLRSMKMKKF